MTAPGPRSRLPAAVAATAAGCAAALILAATPAAAAARPAPAPAAAARAVAGGCGIIDVGCQVGQAVTSWFAGLVRSALSPLLALIRHSALATPQPAAIAAVRTMWGTSLAVADTCYVLLVLAGAIVVMGHQTLQASWTVKEIAPRVVVGFVAANLSMAGISGAVTFANALSAALAGPGITPAAAAASLLRTLGNSVSSGGVFLILLALAGVVLALVLAVVYVLRLMAVVLLGAAAPLALAMYALPQTAWAARWWCRAMAAALAIQAAQSLVLTAAVQVFFSPGWLPWHPDGYLEQMLITLCLLYVLARIPFWITRPVLSGLGHSPLRRAARFAVTAAVLSRVAPLLRGGTPGKTSTSRKGKGP